MLTKLKLRADVGPVRVWVQLQDPLHAQVCRQGYAGFYRPLGAKGWNTVWDLIKDEVKTPAYMSLRQEFL